VPAELGISLFESVVFLALQGLGQHFVRVVQVVVDRLLDFCLALLVCQEMAAAVSSILLRGSFSQPMRLAAFCIAASGRIRISSSFDRPATLQSLRLNVANVACLMDQRE
jgi:hypothetical protein